MITADGTCRKMKVKIEVSKMISFKKEEDAIDFNAHTVSVPARGSRRVVPIAAFIVHNFSIPHDLLQHGSPHNLLGATGQPGNLYASSPRQRTELHVLAALPNTRQSNLHREIEAITIQTGADQPLQPTIVALTSRGEKMESGRLGVASGFRVSIYRLPVVRQVRR